MIASQGVHDTCFSCQLAFGTQTKASGRRIHLNGFLLLGLGRLTNRNNSSSLGIRQFTVKPLGRHLGIRSDIRPALFGLFSKISSIFRTHDTGRPVRHASIVSSLNRHQLSGSIHRGHEYPCRVLKGISAGKESGSNQSRWSICILTLA